MQRYKSLEDLGVKREDCYLNWMEEGLEEDKRKDKWKEERETYGIDERYTWNWSDDFMDYVYIHLKMFNEVNIVDFNAEFEEINNKKISVQDIMDKILNWFETKYYPKKLDMIDYENYGLSDGSYDMDKYTEDLTAWCKEKQEMLDLFAKIISHLNW